MENNIVDVKINMHGSSPEVSGFKWIVAKNISFTNCEAWVIQCNDYLKQYFKFGISSICLLYLPFILTNPTTFINIFYRDFKN
jgi:hypothetical protein